MIRRPPRSTRVRSSAASDVYKRQDEYIKLTGEGIDNAADISAFLCDESLTATLVRPEERPGNIIYHDPCHSINYLGLKDEPRRLLKALGFGLIEPADRGCCGLGGTV